MPHDGAYLTRGINQGYVRCSLSIVVLIECEKRFLKRVQLALVVGT